MLSRRKLFGFIPIPFLAALPEAKAETFDWVCEFPADMTSCMRCGRYIKAPPEKWTNCTCEKPVVMHERDQGPFEGHGYCGNFMTLVGSLIQRAHEETQEMTYHGYSVDISGLSPHERHWVIDVVDSIETTSTGAIVRFFKKLPPYAHVEGADGQPTVSIMVHAETDFAWVCFYDPNYEAGWRCVRKEWSEPERNWIVAH